MSKPIGIYVHVPFCAGKCPYCDFYSKAADERTKDAYVTAILREFSAAAGTAAADTLYFGGGTPSLLGGERIAALVTAAKAAFSMSDDAEITMEANPGDDLESVLSAFKAAGGNRVSLGVQATDDVTLRALGRRHTAAQAKAAVKTAHACGIENVSVDLMLGLEGQKPDAVRRAVSTVASWDVTHVSAYLLKIEEGTPFASRRLTLPDEDETAALYLTAVAALRDVGCLQYEISNFAKPGYESRHNLKYWNGEEYRGFGPAAHSFFEGRRFYFDRDLDGFLQGTLCPREEEDAGFAPGSKEEYALLRLRLTEGLQEARFRAIFGEPIPQKWRERAASLPPQLVRADDTGIRLSPEGFLVSNAIFASIL